MTPNSSQISFCTPEQFLLLNDWRFVAQLIMDDGSQATHAAVLTSPELAYILLCASGDVESALVSGGRYKSSDLQAANGASQAFLQKIVADIACCYLFDRRRAQDPPELVLRGCERAWEKVDKLISGELTLAFQEVQDAGVVDNEYMFAPDIINQNLFTTACKRSLGTRQGMLRPY